MEDNYPQKGVHRVVFLIHVGRIAALFCDDFVRSSFQWTCEYRFGQLKWRLVDYKVYSSISRLASFEEYQEISTKLKSEGYIVTSVLTNQIPIGKELSHNLPAQISEECANLALEELFIGFNSKVFPT